MHAVTRSKEKTFGLAREIAVDTVPLSSFLILFRDKEEARRKVFRRLRPHGLIIEISEKPTSLNC